MNISGPGINSYKEINTPVSGSDLLPTIADLEVSIILNSIMLMRYLKKLNKIKKIMSKEMSLVFFSTFHIEMGLLKRPHSAEKRRL